MSKQPKQQLEKYHGELTLRITDGEHDLPMGRVRINWEAPPGSSFSGAHLFTAALLGAQRHFSALMKGLGLRHRWRIYDDAGNSISLQGFDAKLAEAKLLKEPLTLKRLGIQTVSIEG